ncbi:MAG: hypothetical protein KDA80_00280, partial [Planctomycetaceae bacterium]|nr:hypothetical protein [Planctomycetaceae bacterium]
MVVMEAGDGQGKRPLKRKNLASNTLMRFLETSTGVSQVGPVRPDIERPLCRAPGLVTLGQ